MNSWIGKVGRTSPVVPVLCCLNSCSYYYNTSLSMSCIISNAIWNTPYYKSMLNGTDNNKCWLHLWAPCLGMETFVYATFWPHPMCMYLQWPLWCCKGNIAFGELGVALPWGHILHVQKSTCWGIWFIEWFFNFWPSDVCKVMIFYWIACLRQKRAVRTRDVFRSQAAWLGVASRPFRNSKR